MTIGGDPRRLGVTVALQHAKDFDPTPDMTPAQIAFGRGKEARRKGQAERSPYDYGSLADEWLRGYNDPRK